MDVGPDTVSGFPEHNYACFDPLTQTAYTANPVDSGSTPLGITILGISPTRTDSARILFRWRDWSHQWNTGTTDSSFPFNPATTIRYQLPSECRVRLRIYDLLGRVICTLTDGVLPAGYRSVVWDASGVSGGVYIA